MTTRLPIIETQHLRIRPLTLDDLHDANQVYLDAGWFDPAQSAAQILEERHVWLEWSVRNEMALANLHQPPYGERAVIVKASGQFAGMVGLVPCLGPFGLLPFYQARGLTPADPQRAFPEVGLFWAFLKAHQGQGYATEAARALIDHAFTVMNLARIVAETDDDNRASQAVMRRLGMTVERNPHAAPPWFQVTGILENTHTIPGGPQGAPDTTQGKSQP